MNLNAEDVRAVAQLARLEMNETEVAQYAVQLTKILEHIEQLQQVDTSVVSPMITASVSGNVFREDVPGQSLDRVAALACAPAHDDRFFLVPQVIE